MARRGRHKGLSSKIRGNAATHYRNSTAHEAPMLGKKKTTTGRSRRVRKIGSGRM